MPRLLDSPHLPDHRRQIRALLTDLAEDRAALDLDTVDGEFYWRICRTDLLAAVEEHCAALTAPLRDYYGEPIREAPDEGLAVLRLELRRASHTTAIEAKAAALYPRAVWRRLLTGERVAMRAAEVSVHCNLGNDGLAEEPVVRLNVYSGAWTGNDVEAEVRRQAPDPAMWAQHIRRPDASARPYSPVEPVHLTIHFAFSDPARRSADVDDPAPPLAPSVAVTIPFPLPPAGAIAREYDALVRDRLEWHRQLRGGGTRQETEVALRTWAAALLVADGMRFGEAMSNVCQWAGLDEVSQTRFGQDRQRLVERVPEAECYLYAREPRSDSLAKADAVLPPLQPPADEPAAYT